MSQPRLLNYISALVLIGGLGSLQAVYSPAHAQQPSHPVAIRQATADAVASRPAARTTREASRPAAIGLKREVFGFALASSLSDPTFGYPSWNFYALSTVAFFGLHIDWNGTIIADSEWAVWSSSALPSLLATAHAHSAKVVVTIILQDFQPGTPTMCAGLINRAITVTQTVAQVIAKHVDGVNVDYEGLNGTCQNGQTARAMLTDFAHQLRVRLPPGSYLSIDTYASSATDPLGFFDVPGLNNYVDSFFVMAYDLEYSNYLRAPLGCSSFCLGPTAPLTGYYYNDTSTASQYISAAGASKVILGVPYYGRKSCVGGVAPNAYPIGLVEADSYLSASGESTDPAVAPGSYTAHRDAHDPPGYVRWDTWFNVNLRCTRELYWDDVTALGAKYDLVNRDGLRGVGIWTLNYGGAAPELWTALLNHFGGCASVTDISNPASPAAVGSAVSVTGTASGCPNANARYGFWLQAPGSITWQLVQLYSTNPTFRWNTTGKAAGTYHLSVWALDAGSTGIYGNSLGRWDAYVALQYVLTPPCSSVSVYTMPPSWIIGAAAGCPSPMYQFWMLGPGSITWQLVQAYSSSATYKWNTAGLPAGEYRFSIWARDTHSGGTSGNSLGRWDAYKAVQYLVVATCSSVGATFAPSTSATAGTTVSVAASASRCPNPLYAFWVLAPGSGAWQLVQAYSSNPKLSWSTSGKPAGTYQFSVWGRDAASTGIYGNSLGKWDAYAATQYVLFIPCSSVTVFTAPPSWITGAAAGCTSPLYEFWMLPPGSATWQLVQAYSTIATYKWSLAGLPKGVYQFSIWARDFHSAGTSGDSFGRWDAYTSRSYRVS